MIVPSSVAKLLRSATIAGLSIAAMLAGPSAFPAPTNELHDALKLKPDAERGRALYGACAACHQADGSGQAKNGIPNIANQHYEVILKQLTDFRDSERWDERMTAAAMQHRLRNAQALADVAKYVTSLPAVTGTETGSGEAIPIGESIYTKACAYCHGATGKGNSALRYPRLAGQHYSYLARQIRIMARGGRPNVAWEHGKVLSTLTEREVIGVADYISRMPAPETEQKPPR